ncbi:MAG: hypothetical protein VYA34_10400 [Myxococcota bacterium]|nr:hypothetical protein [Myxococcota bacterium]
MKNIIVVALLLSSSLTLAQSDSNSLTPNEFERIEFQQYREASRIKIRLSDFAQYKVQEIKPTQLRVILQGTQIYNRINELPLDTRYFDSPVRLITILNQEPPNQSVEIDIFLRKPTRYRHSQRERFVYLDFARHSLE